jgi:hypothetical protein
LGEYAVRVRSSGKLVAGVDKIGPLARLGSLQKQLRRIEPGRACLPGFGKAEDQRSGIGRVIKPGAIPQPSS